MLLVLFFLFLMQLFKECQFVKIIVNLVKLASIGALRRQLQEESSP